MFDGLRQFNGKILNGLFADGHTESIPRHNLPPDGSIAIANFKTGPVSLFAAWPYPKWRLDQ